MTNRNAWIDRQSALEDRTSGNKTIRLPAGKRLSIRNGKNKEVAWINALGAASFAGTINLVGGALNGDLLVNGSLTVMQNVMLRGVVKDNEPASPVAGMLWIDPSGEVVPSEYLPLTGGTVTGNLHVTGEITSDMGIKIQETVPTAAERVNAAIVIEQDDMVEASTQLITKTFDGVEYGRTVSFNAEGLAIGVSAWSIV